MFPTKVCRRHRLAIGQGVNDIRLGRGKLGDPASDMKGWQSRVTCQDVINAIYLTEVEAGVEFTI
jgi:hypothetical protein